MNLFKHMIRSAPALGRLLFHPQSDQIALDYGNLLIGEGDSPRTRDGLQRTLMGAYLLRESLRRFINDVRLIMLDPNEEAHHAGKALYLEHCTIYTAPNGNTEVDDEYGGMSPDTRFHLWTEGLRRFGLPELDVDNVPAEQVVAAAEFVQFWAAYMLTPPYLAEATSSSSIQPGEHLHYDVGPYRLVFKATWVRYNDNDLTVQSGLKGPTALGFKLERVYQQAPCQSPYHDHTDDGAHHDND